MTGAPFVAGGVDAVGSQGCRVGSCAVASRRQQRGLQPAGLLGRGGRGLLPHLRQEGLVLWPFARVSQLCWIRPANTWVGFFWAHYNKKAVKASR